MNSRTKIIEENLNVILPQDYKDFIDDIGIISDERGEIFGYIEGIDTNKIPCVIGATNSYREDYKNITDNEVVISFDDFKNTPIILNTKDEAIYSICFETKTKISKNFKEWLKNKVGVLS